MPSDVQFLSLAGSLVRCTDIQASLADAVLHLFKSGFAPSPGNILSDYTDNECDFDNYAPLTIATWASPVLAPGTGYMTYAPLQTFSWVLDVDAVQNSVGGAYLVSDGGDLLDVIIFGTARPMQGPGQTVILTPAVAVPTGP